MFVFLHQGTYATDPSSSSCTECDNKVSNSTRSTGSKSPGDCGKLTIVPLLAITANSDLRHDLELDSN